MQEHCGLWNAHTRIRTHIWTKWGWFVFLLLPFYPAWCGGGLLAVEGMLEVVIPRSALSVIARLCLFTPAKMSWSSRPFDPALMSPQYVSLSESQAPLHNPVIGKRNVTKRCSLNILNGAHQRFVPVIECVEETNTKRNNVAPANISTEEINLTKWKERGKILSKHVEMHVQYCLQQGCVEAK